MAKCQLGSLESVSPNSHLKLLQKTLSCLPFGNCWLVIFGFHLKKSHAPPQTEARTHARTLRLEYSKECKEFRSPYHNESHSLFCKSQPQMLLFLQWIESLFWRSEIFSGVHLLWWKNPCRTQLHRRNKYIIWWKPHSTFLVKLSWHLHLSQDWLDLDNILHLPHSVSVQNEISANTQINLLIS